LAMKPALPVAGRGECMLIAISAEFRL